VVTNRILDSLSTMLGAEGLDKLAEQMAERWVGERIGRLGGKSLPERVAEVAKIRNEEGAWAEQTDDLLRHRAVQLPLTAAVTRGGLRCRASYIAGRSARASSARVVARGRARLPLPSPTEPRPAT
jgi:hypothetical protein